MRIKSSIFWSRQIIASLSIMGLFSTSCGDRDPEENESDLATVAVKKIDNLDYDEIQLIIDRKVDNSWESTNKSFKVQSEELTASLPIGLYRFELEYIKNQKTSYSSRFCTNQDSSQKQFNLKPGVNEITLIICDRKESPMNSEADLTITPEIVENESNNCPILPTSNPWNTDISELEVHPNSDKFISNIGEQKTLHPDFGSGEYNGAPIGIPYVIVDAAQKKYPVNFTEWPEESDPGPYPIPLNAPIEGTAVGTLPQGGGDHHVIALDKDNCLLYELFRASPTVNGWQAYNGAVFDLRSDATPPRVGNAAEKIGWTSADAAGLPIFPGLIRYEEIEKGEISHAIRFTVSKTQKGFVLPATHWASSSSDPDRPPMGLRLRLKADFDISGFSTTNQIILRALKKYGMILADNGSDWFLSGAPDSRWDNDDLRQLKSIKGSSFEVVNTGEIITAY